MPVARTNSRFYKKSVTNGRCRYFWEMRLWLCIVLVGLSLCVNADERFGKIGRYSIEAQYHFGRILKHNKKFSPAPTEFTHGMEWSFYKQTLGEHAWQRKLHYPELGASFLFLRHGDNAFFGNAYLLMGVAKFWIVRSRFVDFYVRAGSGIALVPRHFDLQDNPTNTAIGSTLNSSAQVKLGLDLKPHPQVQINAGVAFTHYSNSAVQMPNLGVNMPSAFVGLRYFPSVSGDLRYNRNKVPKPVKRHEVMLKFSMGFEEMRPYQGPKFPLYMGTINYAYYTSVSNKILAGGTVEFSQAAYDFIGYYGNIFKYNRTASSLTAGLFVGDEVLLGKVGLFFIAGGYVFNPRRDTPVFVKIGANYYFAAVGKTKTTRFFIGSNLKSHFFVAQFYEFSSGIAF